MNIKEKMERLKSDARESQISPENAKPGDWVLIEDSRGSIRLKRIDRVTKATIFVGTSRVRKNKMRLMHSEWAWSDYTVIKDDDAREIASLLKTSRLVRQISEAISNPAEVPVELAEEIVNAWRVSCNHMQLG